ncbi:MAG: hypothetical protein GY754_08785 [bacterium]|nr:hypothetical protein [bacterium]
MKKLWIIPTVLAFFMAIMVNCESEMPDEMEIGTENFTMLSSGLTYAEKQNILWVHNEERNFINGTIGLNGSNRIPELFWDDALAASAQQWANQCRLSHSTPGGKYGENLAATSTYYDVDNVKKMVKIWVDQKYNGADIVVGQSDREGIKQFYQYLDVTPFSFEPFYGNYSHFTQVVWKETEGIGCGLALCDDLAYGQDMNLLVCRYRFAGNRLGEEIF